MKPKAGPDALRYFRRYVISSALPSLVSDLIMEISQYCLLLNHSLSLENNTGKIIVSVLTLIENNIKGNATTTFRPTGVKINQIYVSKRNSLICSHNPNPSKPNDSLTTTVMFPKPIYSQSFIQTSHPTTYTSWSAPQVLCQYKHRIPNGVSEITVATGRGMHSGHLTPPSSALDLPSRLEEP